MNLSKAIRQVCVTAACVMLGTATVFAADMGRQMAPTSMSVKRQEQMRLYWVRSAVDQNIR